MTKEQQYRDLIRRVAKIDRKAALFMTRKLPLLVKRGLIRVFPCDCLPGCFLFATTPHGCDYWANIADALGEWR